MAHLVLFSPVYVSLCFAVHHFMLSLPMWSDIAQQYASHPSVIWKWTDLTTPELADEDESHQSFPVMCI